MASQRLVVLAACAVVLICIGLFQVAEAEKRTGRGRDRDDDEGGSGSGREREERLFTNRHTDFDHHPMEEHSHMAHHSFRPSDATGGDAADMPEDSGAPRRKTNRGRNREGGAAPGDDTIVDRAAKNNAPPAGQDLEKGGVEAARAGTPGVAKDATGKTVLGAVVNPESGNKDETDVQKPLKP